MLSPKLRVLTIACGFAVVALLLCAGTSSAQYGCSSCAAPAMTYQAYYAPMTVTAYQPVAPCNSCSGYGGGYSVGYGAVTTYRPLWGGWSTRLVPYAAYRPVYASPVAYASYYSPYTSYYSPCTSCSPCVGSCGTAACGTTSSCSSCSATTTYSNETPTPAGSQKTFQTEKPATDENLKPKPDTQLNSMPAPTLQDPRDRVTSRPTYASPRVELTAQRVQTLPVKDDGGWQASKD